MSKRVRKGISLLASFALGSSLLIGTFAAPASAVVVADSVDIRIPTGVKADFWYDNELHGQVCDFFYNQGEDYDYSDVVEGVFINGTFSGPNAAEMELVDVTLVEMPAGSDQDEIELDWVDFNRYNRDGSEYEYDASSDLNDIDRTIRGEFVEAEIDDYVISEDDEVANCSSDHDFEVFMYSDGLDTWSQEAYWDVAGDYKYQLVFKNIIDIVGGEPVYGEVEIVREETITVAGDIDSSDVELSAAGGAETDSVIWPVAQEDFYAEEDYDFFVDGTLRFYDADGNLTHDNWLYTDMGWDYSGVAFQEDDWYSYTNSSASWGENLWIMSNDNPSSGDWWWIHDGDSSADDYSDIHDAEYGYGFNKSKLWFLVPEAYDEIETAYTNDYNDYDSQDYNYSGDDLSNDGVRLIGLVDRNGDFTEGPGIHFLVGGGDNGVSTFWIRYVTNPEDYLGPTSHDDMALDSDTVTVDVRDWVSITPGDLSNASTVVLGEGIARAQNGWCNTYCYDDTWFVRTDVGSVQYRFTGGSSNAGKFIDVYDESGLSFVTDSDLEYDFNGGTNSDGSIIENNDDIYHVALVGSTGTLTTTFDMSSADDADDYYIEYSSEADSYAADELSVRNPGYFPQFRLQNTSTMSGDMSLGDSDDDGTNAPLVDYNYWKSYLLGSSITLTYKVTDAWNDPIANLPTVLDQDCYTWETGDCSGDDREATFDAYDNYNFTNASGLVSFTVENNQTSDDIAYLHGCIVDIINCQEEHPNADFSDMWTSAVFAAFAADFRSDDDDEESDYLYAEFVRSLDVEDLNLYASGDELNVDSMGDESEEIYASVVPVNDDGVHLSGLPFSVSATDGGYVIADICDEVGYTPDDFDWIVWTSSNCWNDYLSFSDYEDVTLFDGSFVSGTGSRKLHEFYLTGTIVGTTTFTITVGGLSEEIDVEVYNDIWDARYLDSVESEGVIAGNIATATFMVTDRFGNTVEDVDLDVLETGLLEFVISDEDSSFEVDEFDTTDENGMVSFDVVTPIIPNSGEASVLAILDNCDYLDCYSWGEWDDIQDYVDSEWINEYATEYDWNEEVTITWMPQKFDLNVDVVGSGSVSVTTGTSYSVDGSEDIIAGTVVTLTASPAAGWEFAGWSGGACAGLALACTLTMDAAKSVTATFTEIPKYTLSVDVIGSGTVTVTTGTSYSAEGSEDILRNTVVTVSAAAEEGWEFAGWSGGVCSGLSATCTLTMDAAKDVVATFTEIPAPPTPSITIRALKYKTGFKVFTANASGLITRVYVDGKLKDTFVPTEANSFNKYFLKKGGKRTIVVTIAAPGEPIFETVELKLVK